MRKKNPGFMLAERLAKARKEWDGLPVSEDEEKAEKKDRYEYGWHTFKERLLEHSQWFGSLSFAEQERRWQAFLAAFSAKTAVKEKSFIHLLPLLWRGGFHPHKGLSDPEDAAFLVSEAEEYLDICLSLTERKTKMEAQMLLDVLKEKYGYNAMLRRMKMKNADWLKEEKFREQFFLLKEKNNVSELGALVGASIIFSGKIAWLDKFRAVIEQHLPEALVRWLFREEAKKTE